MNVMFYVHVGNKLVLNRMDTFIGRADRENAVQAKDLSALGAIFRYASFVQEQKMYLDIYLDCYHRNLKGKIYTEKGSFYVRTCLDQHGDIKETLAKIISTYTAG